MNELYLPNAFWTNWEKKGEDKSSITALKRIDSNSTIQITTNEGQEDYNNLISQLSLSKITENTVIRFNKKQRERAEKDLIKEQKNKSKMLEELFSFKLKIFETESVKNSENKKIKSKIRKAKSQIEAQALTTLLIGIEEGIIDERAN